MMISLVLLLITGVAWLIHPGLAVLSAFAWGFLEGIGAFAGLVRGLEKE